MTAPVPWSLAWTANGELAPQDRFDLLQSLVTTETEAAQSGLVAAVERMSVAELSLMTTQGVTGLCA